MRHSPTHRSRSGEGGLTLIEIMIVIGVVGLIMFIFGPGLSAVTKGDLRHDAVRVAAALRTAADRAAATAAHHRVVIDLDEDTFVLERCEGKVHMVRSVDEKQAADQQSRLMQAERVAELQKQRADAEQAARMSGVPAEASEMARLDDALREAQEGLRGGLGSAFAPVPCKPITFKDPDGRRLNQKKGMSFKQVWVGHLEQPVTEGQVTINFLPLGRGERAIVEIKDESDNVYALRLHGLTGRVEVFDHALERPEDIMTKMVEVEP